MANAIQLIVGLGNPGPEYAKTRHNAGAWLVEELIQIEKSTIRPEAKFFGLCGKITLNHEDCRLLLPTGYMNRSGQSVKATAKFYQIPAEAILVVHDDLDLPVGTARLKIGGGHGGHNGLCDIDAQLGTQNYWRLRIGIGHPGQRDEVHDYVLHAPSRADHAKIMDSINAALNILPSLVAGDSQKAMQQLHTTST